jgi:hypothetical protein
LLSLPAGPTLTFSVPHNFLMDALLMASRLNLGKIWAETSFGSGLKSPVLKTLA